MKKNLSILGSTGSIGTQTLDVARNLSLEVTALAAYGNIKLLERLQTLLKQRNIEYDVVLLSEISNATVGLGEACEGVANADDTHRLLGAAGLHAALDRLGDGI